MNKTNKFEQFSIKTGSAIFNSCKESQVYCPISLYSALAILANGVDEPIQKEVLSLLEVDSLHTLLKNSSNLQRSLSKMTEHSKLEFANSMWINQRKEGCEEKVRDCFGIGEEQYYNTSCYFHDFKEKKTKELIQNWLREHTNGKVSFEEELNERQWLLILNTIYFYSEWVNCFDEKFTKKELFYKEKNKAILMDFMTKVSMSSCFSRGKLFTRSSLPLKDGGSMFFVLPKEGVTLKELVSTPEQFLATIRGGENYVGRVTWKLPKFAVGCDLDLKVKLANLGMNKMMQSIKTEDGEDTGISVQSVHQQAYIGINEKGVEASAFTDVFLAGMVMSKEKVEMRLNRPFCYGIEKEGVLLFLGTFYGPEESN